MIKLNTDLDFNMGDVMKNKVSKKTKSNLKNRVVEGLAVGIGIGVGINITSFLVLLIQTYVL